MLYSKLFGKTTKTVSSDIKLDAHRLLVQGGFIRESVAGRYFFLPLGQRVQNKIIAIIREEMNRAGAQEMVTPILHPLELWQETNRTNTAGFELMRIKDRRGSDFALGGTAEEMFVDVVRKFPLSYKDFPFNIYQFSPKFRDELRARGGLLRVREFVMKDAYSFDIDEASFKKEYQNMWATYARIYSRLGLKTEAIESDGGYIGGEYCHEFVVPHEVGESKYLEAGAYRAHEDVANFIKEKKNLDEELKPYQEIDAVRGTTMEDGMKFHQLPLWQQIKDVLFVDETGRFVLAIIRGDFDVNEVKLKKLVKAVELRHATDEEIRNQIHSEPGFISPVGIKNQLASTVKLVVVADDSLRTIRNAYGGANKLNRDALNINIDRDYSADLEGDIALAQAGFLSQDGTTRLVEKKGIEVGNIFQLGYHYSSKMKEATFMDKDGKPKQYYMGCYGIGIGRTLQTIVEIFHDDRGIIWPEVVAPFGVQLVEIRSQESGVRIHAEKVYQQLTERGIEVLWDDREDVSAGAKFADADLIGCPVRLVVSQKTGEKVEWKRRTEKESELVTVDEVLKRLKA